MLTALIQEFSIDSSSSFISSPGHRLSQTTMERAYGALAKLNADS
jgi:hypothetical protein